MNGLHTEFKCSSSDKCNVHFFDALDIDRHFKNPENLEFDYDYNSKLAIQISSDRNEVDLQFSKI